MNDRIRLTARNRKEQILHSLLPLAENIGYDKLNQRIIAQELKVSYGLVIYHFGTMVKFKSELVKLAIKQKRLPIIKDAILARHPAVKRIPYTLRQQVLNTI